MASRNNAIVKPISDKLLFLIKGQGTSASGKVLPPVKVKQYDVLQWSNQEGDRKTYSSVVTRYWDYIEAEYVTVAEPVGQKKGNTFTIAEVFNNKEEAMQAAKAKLKELQRSTSTLNLTLLGDPELTAEGSLTVEGFHKEVNGSWIIKSVTHNYNNSGYQSVVQAYPDST